jgi:hypothetical protein
MAVAECSVIGDDGVEAARLVGGGCHGGLPGFGMVDRGGRTAVGERFILPVA